MTIYAADLALPSSGTPPAAAGCLAMLLQPAKAGYIRFGGRRSYASICQQRRSTCASLAICAAPSPPARQPRSRCRSSRWNAPPAGTVIQPTTTIIPDGNGHRTIIIIPRQRSYLDTGTEVSVGDRGFRDYMLPPGGDPGRPNWFVGPESRATAAIRCRARSIFRDSIRTRRSNTCCRAAAAG